MKKTRKFAITLIAMALVLCVTSAFAGPVLDTRLYTSGAMDGMAGRDWYSGAYNWADNTSTTVQARHQGPDRWLYRGLVIIDISSLAGKTLQPNSTTFNFYTFGITGTSLQFSGGDPGPEVVAGHSQAGGTEIAYLSGIGEGWQSYDVTSLVQSAASASQPRVGFIFNVTQNWQGGDVAASEDPLGRGSYLKIVPEPSGLLALMSGITGLAGFVLRRKSG